MKFRIFFTLFGQLYLAVAQPVVIAVVVRLAVEGRGVAVIVVHELEVVEAVADALRAEVSEQLQPHAALHHAGGVAGALALAAGLGADGDGLDAGGVLGTAFNRTSRINKISLYLRCLNTHLAQCLNRFSIVKVLVGPFYKEKALLGAFSGHCRSSHNPYESSSPG